MPPATVRRILGCPGGGPDKTHKLSELAARAADHYSPSDVLIASLTKTAAKEIATRAKAIPADQTATLHAHALRALEFDSTLLAETPQAMREFHAAHPALAPDHTRTDNEDAPAQTGGIHAHVTNHRARMTPPEQWTPQERDYAAIWQDYKTQTDRRDFTDLIETVITEQVPPLNRPRVILADEAQDFTKLEMRLLMQWAQGTDSTVCVGDTAQAIYFFRGADPGALEQIPVAHGETLSQSYRCPRAIADVAQAWASQLPGEKVTWTPRDADGAVTEAPYALRDTPDVADAAQQHIAGDGTTMILASCRYMLTPLIGELRARGVPYHNPWSDEPAWNPLHGAGPRALLALLAPTLPDGRMWTWADLHALTDPMQATVLGRGAKSSIKEHCRPDEFNVTHAHETVPLATLATLLGEPIADRLLAIDRRPMETVDWWMGTLLARGASAIRHAVRCWQAGGAHALLDTPRLVVGTVHSTKGGEADHVLLAPELSKEGYYHGYLAGGPDRDAITRMMYVGITRARETLTLLEPGYPEHAPLGDLLRAGAMA